MIFCNYTQLKIKLLQKKKGRDFVCNDTTLFWNKNENDVKEFKFGINNDQHWEHEEIFYMTLSDPMNGIIRDKHRYITVAIIANDEKNCSVSDWRLTNCSVTIGTGIKMRYKTSIEKDPETGKIECVELSESEYCQEYDHISPIAISTSSSIVQLYEGDYERDHFIVTYSLGATPNFYDDATAKKLDQDESFDGCVVKLILLFDDNLDVSASPIYLCWTNITWIQEKTVTIKVENNDKIDDQDPRKRYIEVGELLSVDTRYDELNKENMKIEVLVYDDEYCDPDICKRGTSSPEYDEPEYDDEIQDVETNQAELIVILVIFFCFVIILIGLLIKKRIDNKTPSNYLSMEEQQNKEKIDKEIQEMDEIAKMEQYLAKQQAKKEKKRQKKYNQSDVGIERQSLLLDNSTSNSDDEWNSILTSNSTSSNNKNENDDRK